MKTDNNTLIEKIENLIINSEEFEEVEKSLKYFCPFEAMGMVNQEIRHAHFLSYILDPNRPHEFGDAYLRAFLYNAITPNLEADSPLRPIDIHLMDLSDAYISREKDRIDLRIELPSLSTIKKKKTALIFELKINSKESTEQLSIYKEKMKKHYQGWELIFFFLTLNGDDASEENREEWIPLSLRDVINELEKVSKRSIGQDDARHVVRAYIEMMRRKHVGDENTRLRELAQRLWSEHKEALDFLVSAQPDAVNDALSEIYEKQDAACLYVNRNSDLQLELDQSSKPNEIRLYPVKFDYLNKDENGSRILLLIISRNYSAKDQICFRWMLNDGKKEQREEIYNLFNGNRRKLTDKWTQIDKKIIELNDKVDFEHIKESLSSFAKDLEKRTKDPQPG